MEPLSFTVPPELSGCTVFHVLRDVFVMSRSHISRLKRRAGGILLNGSPAYTTTRCAAGDSVTALISDPPDSKRLEPVRCPLRIVFEDEWLAVIDKPAGMTVHPERSGMGGSVENALSAYFAADEFVHTVSRLDRGTSGLMTVAKCGYMHERMIKLLHTPDFYKEYTALVRGVFDEPSGSVRLPLAHPEGSNYKMAVTRGGLDCLTEYTVLESFGDRSLVKLMPMTGRMHQLRVHMAALGHPIVGDWLYGEEVSFIDRPALHSARLVFRHPMTGETKELLSPLPADIMKLIPSR